MFFSAKTSFAARNSPPRRQSRRIRIESADGKLLDCFSAFLYGSLRGQRSDPLPAFFNLNLDSEANACDR